MSLNKYVGGLSDAAVREPQVQRELIALKQRVDSLKTLSANLVDRLSPVLKNGVEEGDDGLKAERPSLVPLAEEIHSQFEGLTAVEDRLSSVLSRLEV